VSVLERRKLFIAKFLDVGERIVRGYYELKNKQSVFFNRKGYNLYITLRAINLICARLRTVLTIKYIFLLFIIVFGKKIILLNRYS